MNKQEQIFNFIKKASNIDDNILEDSYNNSSLKQIKKAENILHQP